MNEELEKMRLQAKKKQLKLLMVMMLVFMIAGPLLGPKLFAEEFSRLRGAGLYFFYISTPLVFGALFLFSFLMYCRIERKLRGESAGKAR